MFVWIMYHACGVDLLMRFIWQKLSTIQHNFRRFAPRGLGRTSQPLSTYKSRYLLLGLEVLNDRRKVAAALFFRDTLMW
jgi:hypothetical protein